MLKKMKLKNSSILLIGLILIFIGCFLGFYEYFKERKDKAYTEMNIMLYENEEPDIITSDEEIEEKLESENNDTEEPIEEPPKQEPKYDFIGILEIPKINLKRGFPALDSKYNNINYNITVINGSTFPDVDNNNLILAAHSGVCSVCFFDRLFNLSLDDIAYVYYKDVKYQYKIVNIYQVEKTGKVPIYRDGKKNTLTLITCTRYSNTKQTVYILELIDKK